MSRHLRTPLTFTLRLRRLKRSPHLHFAAGCQLEPQPVARADVEAEPRRALQRGLSEQRPKLRDGGQREEGLRFGGCGWSIGRRQERKRSGDEQHLPTSLTYYCP